MHSLSKFLSTFSAVVLLSFSAGARGEDLASTDAGSGRHPLDVGALNVGQTKLPILHGLPVPEFLVAQSLQGTVTSMPITCWNCIAVPSDVLAYQGNGLADVAVNHNVGGTGYEGTRIGILTNIVQTAPIHAAPGNSSWGISGTQSSVTLNASWGGTGVDGVNSAGYATALNPYLTFGPGFTNGGGGSGMEIDVATQGGSSFMDVIGALVVRTANSAAQAARDDDAIAINGPAQAIGTGWKVGLAIGRKGSYAGIDPRGTLILANNAGNVMHAAVGIDFSSVIFSTAFLKSSGFSIDGRGNVIAHSLRLPALPIGVPSSYACFTSAGVLIASATPC